MSKFKSVLLFVVCCLLFVGSVHASWTTDLTPPTVNITASCTTNCTAGSTVTLTIICSDTGSGCKSIEYSSIGATTNLNATFTQDPPSTIPVTVSPSPTVSASSGTVTISAKAFDAAGNISNNGQPITFNITFLEPLAVSCTGIASDMSITWSAAPATGGTSPYSYSWSSADGLSGTGQTVSKTYTTAGTKDATITATDSTSPAITATNSCTATISCASNMGQACTKTSSPNACGQTSTTSGTIQCDGITCSASDPSTPPNTCSYNLTVSKSGTGSGTVTSDSSNPGINCGTDCSETYTHGTQVTLTPTPSSNSTFGGWSEACTNPTGNCIVTMDAAKNVTATFNLACPAAFTLNTPTSSCSGSTPSINLSWNTSSNAASYNILRDGTQIGTTTQTTYEDNNVSNNTTYSYTIQAVNSCGSPQNSNTVSVTSSECRPDLICQNAEVSGALLTGQNITLSGIVKNLGVSDAGTSNTQFKIDSAEVGTAATGSLAQNATEPESISWTATAGNHNLTINTDSGGAVAESNENNNSCSTSASFTVNAPPTCTLINGAANLNTNQTETYTATASDPEGNTLTYSWSASGGSPTSASTSSFTWSTSTPSTYSLDLTVTDDKGATANCPTKPVAVDWPAVSTSCSVTSPTPPATATVGEPVTWTATASGGNGTYSYTWNGDIPLAGKTGNPVNVTYSTTGTKNGSVAVTSAGKNGNATCSTTIEILPPAPPQPEFAANSPSAICSGVDQSNIDISWTVSSTQWIDHYDISRSDGSLTTTIVTGLPALSTTYWDTTVSNPNSYTYQVIAHSTDSRVPPTASSWSSPPTAALNCALPSAHILVNSDGSTSIEHNQSAILTWTSKNPGEESVYADECRAISEPSAGTWTGVKCTSESTCVTGGSESTDTLTNPPGLYLFHIECTNTKLPLLTPGRTKRDSVQVTVKEPIPPFIQTTGGDVHTQERINSPGSQ